MDLQSILGLALPMKPEDGRLKFSDVSSQMDLGNFERVGR
jgi:hypothetical protein